MFDTLPPGTTIAGRYRILRELGRGGMGAVYLVQHAHTGDQLALKVLLGHVGVTHAALERFKREARSSALIKSENMVKITDADVAPELGDAPFLVMELLQGADFDELVRTRGPLQPQQVVTYLLQLGRAIDRAHQIGIVHRDLKPGNLFLHQREDGETIVKVLDFGISKVVDPNGLRSSAGMTQTGVVMGTPLFMSPEQASGDADVGPTADIWAVGLIAVFLLTGEMYWRSTTLSQLILEIVIGAMPPLSRRFPERLPPAVDAWFARSCHRDPAQRFATIREQVQALAVSLGLPDPAQLQRSPAGDTLATETVHELRVELARTATTANPLSLSVESTAPPSPRRALRSVYFLSSLLLVVASAAGWRLLREEQRVPVATASATMPPPPSIAVPPPRQSAVPAATEAPAQPAALELPVKPSASASLSASAVPHRPQPVVGLRPRLQSTATGGAEAVKPKPYQPLAP